MILLRLSLFFSILFFWVPSIAQYSVEGKVVELGTGEPLAFVNIVINGSVSTSTSTDIDGLFRYQLDEEIKTLSFSFIWYEVQDVSADTISDLNNLVITLVPTVDQLQQVTILPGENPAHRIIRNTIKNKDLNNPEK
ncbi:MAG: carboxypeptidase-like regulatory domain-containing protein [Flavobacteriales bacterium]|nr:carboxypeptidase-like regulatory domain-containing protein [Flavobacteriales bacterium]